MSPDSIDEDSARTVMPRIRGSRVPRARGRHVALLLLTLAVVVVPNAIACAARLIGE